MNRQKQILFILLVILALSGVYAYMTTPEQSQVAVSGSIVGSRNDVSSGTKAASDNQKVNLELLELGKEKYQGYKRDIFNYYQPKPKPKPAAVVKVVPKPVVKPVPVIKSAPVVTLQVRKQLARFTFLGFLIKDDVRTVFLSKREELFLVKKADFFGEDDQFEVVEITEAQLTIKQQGANGLIEIPLVEKEPLIPSFSSAEPTEQQGAPAAVNRPPTTVQSRSQVPLQERRKKWFKNSQPTANE